jgi:2-polyprenyl-6-methoxyphenol hydroxylase-like FAD-dependent oxidoreductase
VAIVGAGPVGMEAALACVERGVPFRLYEAGHGVGAGIREWGHVRMFTPWQMTVSPRMVRVLDALGVEVPDDGHCPTGDELVEHALAPLADSPAIAGHLRLASPVRHIAREGLTKEQEIGSDVRAARPFRLIVDSPSGERVERARALIDCSGARALANTVGDGGVPAPGEQQLAAEMGREIPDEAQARAWAGSRVLLVGAGHSAQTAARAMMPLVEEGELAVTWSVRGREPDWGAVADDPLAERAALVAAARRIAGSPSVDFRPGTAVDALRRAERGIAVRLRSADGHEEVEVDRVLALTGRVGDHAIYRQLQVHECYATAGPMALAGRLLDDDGDCLAQTAHGSEALRTPEPGFFVLGAKSYGRNRTFLTRIGYEQVNEVIGMVAA